MLRQPKKFPPPMFHGFFSGVIGAMTAHFIHSHQVPMLIATIVLWALSLVFISARAKRAGGQFLETAAVVYSGFSISFFILGLFLAACSFAIFG